MANNPDNAIDKVLAALREAVPPEGMEARIAQRLAHFGAATRTPASLWRRLLPGSALAAAWWSGALTATAVATLAACTFLLSQHRASPQQKNSQTIPTAQRVPRTKPETATAANLASENKPASLSQVNPCNHAILQTTHPAPTPIVHSLRVETRTASPAPSQAPPAAPLTAQERELIRLARTSDPKQLATLNPENQAKLQEQDAADFDKFFNPPPDPSSNNE